MAATGPGPGTGPRAASPPRARGRQWARAAPMHRLAETARADRAPVVGHVRRRPMPWLRGRRSKDGRMAVVVALRSSGGISRRASRVASSLATWTPFMVAEPWMDGPQGAVARIEVRLMPRHPAPWPPGGGGLRSGAFRAEPHVPAAVPPSVRPRLAARRTVVTPAGRVRPILRLAGAARRGDSRLCRNDAGRVFAVCPAWLRRLDSNQRPAD